MRAIAIGVLGLALVHGTAAAQTPSEQAQILRDFQQGVAEYAAHRHCLAGFPTVVSATAAAPRIFTLPVAMVFRQLIATTLAERGGIAAINGTATYGHAAVLEPFPATELTEFPRVLQEALPPLPALLEYRLIGHDLVIRDREADVIVAVLRDALGNTLTITKR
jgi:hypothetical protein